MWSRTKDYENINIACSKDELMLSDLQKFGMRGIMYIMVLVQYLFFVSLSIGIWDKSKIAPHFFTGAKEWRV